MKFLSFRAGNAAHYGIVDGNNVVDLTPRLKYPDLKALIAADAVNAQNSPWKPHHLMKNQLMPMRVAFSTIAATV